MATKKKNYKKKNKKQHFPIEIIGIIFIILSLLAASQLGFVGILSANLFRFFVGDTFMFAALLLGVYGGYLVLKGIEPPFKNKRIIGLLLAYASALLLLHAQLFAPIMDVNLNVISASLRFFMADMAKNEIVQSLGGGMIGGIMYSMSYFLFAQIGTYLIVGMLWFISIFLILDLSFKRFIEWIRKMLKQILNYLRATSKKVRLIFGKQWSNLKKQKKRFEPVDMNEALNTNSGSLDKKQKLSKENKNTLSIEPKPLEIDSYQSQQKIAELKNKAESNEGSSDEKELEFEIESEPENVDYQLPPSSLLNEIEETDQTNEYALIQRNVKKLEETFKSFGVDAKVTKANLGPAVTKYEIQPAVGVKVSRIVSLSDDIALALAAKDIRMEAPIPGKPFIGIEVPNNEVSLVSFRNVIEGQVKNNEKLLEVPLGRDISGNVAMADLTKMPHLLVAGSTGSGKSVCINGIITSLLMKAKPNEVKLMMIDPKMVELNVYNGIPHLLTPVVTNPKKAAQALQKVVMEMEQRYELFAASGQRNITGYNQFILEKNLENGEGNPTLPFIVVVVDELADLMMVASNEVEDAIIRLAQMARAAGIHMILATQRPSVDVITGIIKANVPSRIAFAVSSGMIHEQ